MEKPLLDVKGVLERLPHRYPFLMVDKVLGYTAFESLEAVKNVTINEPFFQGHFPRNPVMPGVMMLEALAQAAGLLYHLSMQPKEGHTFTFYLASMDSVKFKQIVVPGDSLNLNIQVMSRKGEFWRVIGEASVDGKVVCQAEILSAAKEVPL